ncbi:MAG: type II toxin-antitoxin system RelE/ParE family toxin [Pirellulales bacterium]
MPRLVYSPAAKEDMRGTIRWIAAENPDAADNWYSKTKQRCRLLARYPKLGEVWGTAYGLTVRIFSHGSYVILYCERGSKLEIIRVVRGDRDLDSLDIEGGR